MDGVGPRGLIDAPADPPTVVRDAVGLDAARRGFSVDPGQEPAALALDVLAGRLTGYLVTDPSLLPSVEKLVNESSDRDRVAIGAGLYRAELRCLTVKPEASRKINDFVRKLGDRSVLTGYAAEAEQIDGTQPSQAAKPTNPSSGLLTGEWNTEIADPFAKIPLPLSQSRYN